MLHDLMISSRCAYLKGKSIKLVNGLECCFGDSTDHDVSAFEAV